MKTATVRQLRHDFGSVLAYVEEGESVELSKRGKIIAVLSPPPKKKPAKKRKDFLARMIRMYGEDFMKKAPPRNSVVVDRESRPY